MANPFPFVANTVLTAAQLNGIGESVAFTPTWSNLTVGNATQSFRYVRVQNFVSVQGKITFGSTTAVIGNVSFTTPVTSTNQPDVSFVGHSYLDDSGIGALLGWVAYASNSLFCQSILVSGTYPTAQAFNATTPFVWSVGDSISVNIVYQV